MRLGLVIYGDIATRSGGYFYDRMLVRFLRHYGDEVDIISIPDEGQFWANAFHHHLNTLRDKVRLGRYDILLEDELCHPALFRVNRALRRLVGRCIVAITYHLRASEEYGGALTRARRWVERKFLDSVDSFIFTSRDTRAQAEALLGRPAEGIIALPGKDHVHPLITPEAIRVRSAESGPLRVIFVGNLIARKGLHFLIRALRRLPVDSWRLAIVGGWDLAPEYALKIKRLICETALEKNILMLGPLGGRRLSEEMLRAHVLAVPSTYEGYGIAYQEALGYGLPAIATARGGAREVIRHGCEGFLVDPGDEAALAGYLCRLTQDRAELARMGLAALARFEQLPTWAESLSKVRDYLRGMVRED